MRLLDAVIAATDGDQASFHPTGSSVSQQTVHEPITIGNITYAFDVKSNGDLTIEATDNLGKILADKNFTDGQDPRILIAGFTAVAQTTFNNFGFVSGPGKQAREVLFRAGGAAIVGAALADPNPTPYDTACALREIVHLTCGVQTAVDIEPTETFMKGIGKFAAKLEGIANAHETMKARSEQAEGQSPLDLVLAATPVNGCETAVANLMIGRQAPGPNYRSLRLGDVISATERTPLDLAVLERAEANETLTALRGSEAIVMQVGPKKDNLDFRIEQTGSRPCVKLDYQPPDNSCAPRTSVAIPNFQWLDSNASWPKGVGAAIKAVETWSMKKMFPVQEKLLCDATTAAKTAYGKLNGKDVGLEGAIRSATTIAASASSRTSQVAALAM